MNISKLKLRMQKGASVGLITVTAFTSSLLLMPAPVGAVTPTPGAAQQTRMNNLKQRADTEINRRVQGLQGLITRIQANKRLTDTDKSSYTSDILSQITALNNLKTKIDADTDLTILKADVQSIVSSYRIFALYMPKIAILSHADAMSQAADQISALADKLNTRIQTAQANGNDVAALLTAYNDLLAKVADAKLQYQNAENTVRDLTPAGYPGNKPQLVSARDMLKAGLADLKAARTDIQTIRDGLKAFAPTPSTAENNN